MAQILTSNISPGVSDHGSLTGRGDDDHSQYHNDTRGDARYLYKENTDAFTPDGDYEPATKKYVDDELSTVSGGGDMTRSIYDTDSNNIVDKAETIDDGTYSATASGIKAHLDDAGKHREIDDVSIGATDLWSAQKINTVSGSLQTSIDGKSSTGHTHTESDVTDLDKYTQTEIDTISGSLNDKIAAKDNYQSWSFAVDGVTKDAVTSNDILDFVGGPNITITRSADDKITISGTPGGGSANHSELNELDYASAGHIGFVSTSLLTTTSGDLQTGIDAKDSYQSWSFAVDGVPKDAITSGDVLDFVGGPNITITRTADDQITISGVGVGAGADHGSLTGLDDDDHTQYSLADGTRAFTGTVAGIDPTENYHLSTKKYVDDEIATISGAGAGYIANETPSGAINGSNTVFNLLNTPVSGSVTVYLNGLQQKPGGENYTISGDQITFTDAPIINDIILCNYFIGIVPHGHDDRYYTETEIDTFDFALYSELTTTSGDLQTNIDAKGTMNDLIDDTTPQLGGDLDLNGHNIDYGAILTISGTYEGEIMAVTVDDASTIFGSPLYCEVDFNYKRADADAESSMPCDVLALESGSGSKKVLLKGQICNTSWNWNNGKIYVATVSGTLTQTQPSGDNDIIQVVGRALSADTMFFNPSPEYIKYAV